MCPPASTTASTHEPGYFVYVDERRRRVRVCTFEEAEAMRKAEDRAGVRPQSRPRLSMDMLL
jgi:hypothetical protein